jgi:hypothetical protein
LPLDGIVVDSIALELKDKILGGRIVKIFQPERDEILMHIRATGSNFKLLFSANANYPRVHLTNISKENPSNPPVFCINSVSLEAFILIFPNLTKSELKETITSPSFKFLTSCMFKELQP